MILRFALILAAQDFDAEREAAFKAIEPARKRSNELLEKGDLDGASAALLSAFPPESRTPLQAFVLGELLYGTAPKLSYGLHKLAAEKLPGLADAHLEWAMEQHRAGEYAGAAASYARYSEAVPDYAPALGVAADCLIRQGKSREAVALWRASENAKSGSLERFESLVCDIYRDFTGFERRQALLAKTRAGDPEAAAALIALDCAFRLDWWNAPPQAAFLKHDLETIRAAKLPAGRRLDALECAAALASLEDPKAVLAELSKRGFLVDADRSIPPDGLIASFLLNRAFQSDALRKADASKTLGDKFLKLARESKDVEHWNIGVGLCDASVMEALEKEAWEATRDPRFATACLLLRGRAGTLKAEDPLLAEALKAHPEHSELVKVAVILAKRDGRLTEDWLTRGIKAEYRRFSTSGLNPRPRAATLRAYFKDLGELLK